MILCQSACAKVGRARKSVSWAWLSPTRKYFRGNSTVQSFPPPRLTCPMSPGLSRQLCGTSLGQVGRSSHWDICMHRHAVASLAGPGVPVSIANVNAVI